MKRNTLTLAALAASSLLFASCGDKDSSAGNGKEGPPEPAANDSYPLTVCVVSGEPLGSMGKPHIITHEGTEVRFCCKECLPKFEQDPDKYLAKLRKTPPADDTSPGQ